MAWDMDKFKRTLFITRNTDGTFGIYPWMRIIRSGGDNYMEPLTAELLAIGTSDLYRFSTVEFIDAPGIKRGSDSSDLYLTGDGPETSVRRGNK